MRNIFSLWEDLKILGTQDPETLLYKVLPHNALKLLSAYFRLQIEGLQHIPRRGAALIVPNHSGASGLDSLLLSYAIYENLSRVPRVLTHEFWFRSELTAAPMRRLGFVQARMSEAEAQLRKKNLLILFPEGEDGNFKPTKQRYTLQPFRLGFVRLSILHQCPIVPTLIIGAEETHINLKKLRWDRWNLKSPLPLNLVPFPSRLRIKFLPPIYVPYSPAALDEPEILEDLASDIREQMQIALSEEIAKRKSLFF